MAVYQEFSPHAPPAARSDFARLPIVDIAPLFHADFAARKAAAAKLDSAAREAGFCYIVGHPLTGSRVTRLISQARTFFSRSIEEKMRWYIGDSAHHRGYVPEGEEVFSGGTRDRKEAFDVGFELPEDDPDVLAGTPTMGPNVWPDLPGFQADVGSYYHAALGLGTVLFRGFALALGLDERFFDRFVTKPPSQLRLIHYPYNADARDAVGIGSHTDYECFTILLSTAPGLEVMNGAGKWIDAPPCSGKSAGRSETCTSLSKRYPSRRRPHAQTIPLAQKSADESRRIHTCQTLRARSVRRGSTTRFPVEADRACP